MGVWHILVCLAPFFIPLFNQRGAGGVGAGRIKEAKNKASHFIKNNPFAMRF
jgi:hypothetical protein